MSQTDRSKLAVALDYDPESCSAPRVTAKGRGAVAERIIETAEAHGIVIEDNPHLAEALSAVEIDDQIPIELYEAVAEVIGFVLGATSAGRR
ncbi:MAG: EscU/YscU/HrcU family type III secretion system export apparatus switch protein [Hyphomicrobiales bacterium]|nr:EscU/YscU/HrcU family type III secretion system export apparatus switch protein [Hyphomicrobiales bacterium]